MSSGPDDRGVASGKMPIPGTAGLGNTKDFGAGVMNVLEEISTPQIVPHQQH